MGEDLTVGPRVIATKEDVAVEARELPKSDVVTIVVAQDGVDPAIERADVAETQGAKPQEAKVTDPSPGVARVQRHTGALLNPVGNLTSLSKALAALEPGDRVAGAAAVLDSLDGLSAEQKGHALSRLIARVGVDGVGAGGDLEAARDIRALLVHQYLMRLPAGEAPDARVLEAFVEEPGSRWLGMDRDWPTVAAMPRADYATRAQHVLGEVEAWNARRAGAELGFHETAKSLGYAGTWVDDGTVFAVSFPNAEGELDFVELGDIDEPLEVLETLHMERFGISAADYKPMHTLDASVPEQRKLIDAHMAALAYQEPESVVSQLRAWGFSDADMQTFQWLDHAETDTQGFRVIKDGVLYDVGRGTAGATDAKIDADIGKVQAAWLVDGLETHGGFTRAAMADIHSRAAYLVDMADKGLLGVGEIAVSGHSLGASYKTISMAWMLEALSDEPGARERALAVLPQDQRREVAAALDRLDDCRMRATFLGSPLAGNKAFAKHLDERVAQLGDRSGGFVRVRYGGDLVTKIPPTFLGFAHAFSDQRVGPSRRAVLPEGVEGPEDVLRDLHPDELEQVLELAFLPEEQFDERMSAEKNKLGGAQERGLGTALVAFALAKMVRDGLDHFTSNYLHELNAEAN